MEHSDTGCQSAPKAPILCANNCGFFGSSATMNLCSKCHKDVVLKQEQENLAASSIRSIMNGGSSISQESAVAAAVDVQGNTSSLVTPKEASPASELKVVTEEVKVDPSRCNTCRKRVGLTGFNCRCGHFFCAAHRYSDKHDCSFNYRAAGQEAIAKANPVVKAKKLDKV